jgi:hypothetical protein
MLAQVTDEVLINLTGNLVREEREILTNLLHHFKEIERRRLYCDYKYGSLHKMLVGHFGYSDDEAYRRVAATRLITELPEIELKINSGDLSLAHLGMAQSFFRRESKILATKVPKKLKLRLIESISAKPIREAQRIALAQSSAPEKHRTEKIVPVSDGKSEFQFTADKSLEGKLNELKGLLAHKHPNLSIGDLLEIVCDLSIDKLKADRTSTNANSGKTSVAHRKQSVKKSVLQIRREIVKEGQHKCSNCQSRYAVEIDHIKAKARGGKDSKENLRLLCRPCNQREAIKQLGLTTMEKYLKYRTVKRSQLRK